MDVKSHDKNIYVTLSERNVKQLLIAFQRGYTQGLCRRCEDGSNLYIQVESDAHHYRDREAGPGLEPYLAQSDRVVKQD